MCNNCIHAPVCGKCKATGGHVGKCEFYGRRYGRWIRRGNEMKCSNPKCQFIYYANHDDFSYCPNCGAKMDGAPHA